jgi:hypothetical protein
MCMIQDTFIHVYDTRYFHTFICIVGFVQLHYLLLHGMLCYAYFEIEFGHVPLFVQFQRVSW